MIVFTCPLAENIAEKNARGVYQRALIEGNKRVSGSDLAGKWRSTYSKSREALLDRLQDAGLYLEERRVDRRKFIVVGISEADCDTVSDEDLDAAWY